MTTPRRNGKHGLPVFLAHELAAIRKEGSTALVVLSVAGKIQFGVTADPNRWTRNVACNAKAETSVLHIAWAPDARLARRIRDDVERVLDGRKIRSNCFDVPVDFAMAALDHAVAKVGIELRGTDELLASHAVRECRKRVSRHAFKELINESKARKLEEHLLAGIAP